MKNKFNKGDIVYSVDVNEHLIINVNKLIIGRFFFNDRPETNTYIYSYIGLENNVIRDHEIETSELNRYPGKHISGSCVESHLYSKEELESAIQRRLEERIQQNENSHIAAEQFRCPLTGGKIIQQKHNNFVLDGSTVYKVEGSDVIWEKYSRDWKLGLYHTNYKGIEYVFEYLNNGNWKELQLIEGDTGRGFYVDKVLYDSGDETITKEIEEFLEKEKIAHQKWQDTIKSSSFNSVGFPLIKEVRATTKSFERITVQPMSAPSGLLNYLDIPKRDTMIINIQDEGQYEIDADVVKGWEYKEVSPNLFEFGNIKFSIVKNEQ